MKIYNIVLSSEAKSDLKNIFEYIKDVNSEYYARRVIERIARKIATYEVFPERNDVIYTDTAGNHVRHTTEGRYRIIYVVEQDDVLIARIISSKRDLSNILA